MALFFRQMIQLRFFTALMLVLCFAGNVLSESIVQPVRAVKVITLDDVGTPLRFPSRVSYDPKNDELYITSPQQSKLVVMTADYFPFLSVGKGRGLQNISGSLIKDGRLYVCCGSSKEEPRPHIAVLDGAFLPERNIYFPDFEKFSPNRLALAEDGKIYTVGLNGTGVYVLNADGTYLRTIQPKDNVFGEWQDSPILSLAIGKDGNLYLVSESMGRVYVYDRNEKYLFKFGEKGGEAGKLSRPVAIAVDDPNQRIYLVDYQRHTVAVYSKGGGYLFEFSGMGQGRGWLLYPNDIAIDGLGRLVVADSFNHRIQVFELVGPGPAIRDEHVMIAGGGRGEGDETDVPVKRALNASGPSTQPVSDDVANIPTPEAVETIATTVPEGTEGQYVLLVSFSRHKEMTDAVHRRLLDKGYQAFVREVEQGPSGQWFRVMVGPFGDFAQALETMQTLKQQEQLNSMIKKREMK